MKRIAAILLLLAGCGQSQQEKDRINMADKMGILEKTVLDPNGLPDFPIRCTFVSRAYCIGADCRNLKPQGEPMYIEINKIDKTYKRCGPQKGDCDTYGISIYGSPGSYQNIVVADSGTLVKYAPNGHFTDIATQAAQTFISDGKCERATPP